MKDIIDKLPPCPEGTPDECAFEIAFAVKTDKPFHPVWNRAGKLIKANPNRTVGVVECQKCSKTYEYRFNHTVENGRAGVKVKEITSRPPEVPEWLETRRQKYENVKADKAREKALNAAATRRKKS